MPRGAYFLEVALRALWHDLNHDGSLERARGKPEEILALLDHPDLEPPSTADAGTRARWASWEASMREAARDLARALEGEDLELAKRIWRTRLVEVWKARDEALVGSGSR